MSTVDMDRFFLVGLDSDCGNFALQVSGALLSPNATSDFRLPSKNAGSVGGYASVFVCSVV